MVYEIKGDKAILTIPVDGKEGEIVLRELSVKEWAYALDEFMTIKDGKPQIKAGAMILTILPKCIEKAPFPITENNSSLNAKIKLSGIMEIVQAVMELNGFIEGEKKEGGQTTSIS